MKATGTTLWNGLVLTVLTALVLSACAPMNKGGDDDDGGGGGGSDNQISDTGPKYDPSKAMDPLENLAKQEAEEATGEKKDQLNMALPLFRDLRRIYTDFDDLKPDQLEAIFRRIDELARKAEELARRITHPELRWLESFARFVAETRPIFMLKGKDGRFVFIRDATDGSKLLQGGFEWKGLATVIWKQATRSGRDARGSLTTEQNGQPLYRCPIARKVAVRSGGRNRQGIDRYYMMTTDANCEGVRSHDGSKTAILLGYLDTEGHQPIFRLKSESKPNYFITVFPEQRDAIVRRGWKLLQPSPMGYAAHLRLPPRLICPPYPHPEACRW